MSTESAKINYSTSRLIPVIFHLVFWTIWIAFPFVTNPGNERFREFSIAMLPVTLTQIPLFLLNSEWLIPKVYRKQGVGTYLIYLLLLLILYSTAQLILKEWIVPDALLRRHWDVFWSVVPALFILAISTGYGFIFYQIKQDQAAQEAKQEHLKSELSFLRSQISPHFIFNILNSIVYLIRSKSSQAESVTIQLSELMRYMLYEASDDQVPIEKEIEYLKNYIELQRIRFGDDVEIKVAIEGQPSNQLIEPMLLIPFVENSFKHGVGLIKDPIIEIILNIHGQHLEFQVKNRITPDSSDAKDRDSGIGLKNVKRRLELLYPNLHNLDIHSSGTWFEVNLNLELSVKQKNL